MGRFNKKAIMGIGTLIIFIATILVAAVAAGVLISTSGILQQKALITGQEARKQITNGVNIISILAHGNKTDESLNNFEMLIRLSAGSDSLQMKKFDLTWIGPTYDAAASLEHDSLDKAGIDSTGFNEAVGSVDNTGWTYIRDLDDDGILEKVKVIVNWTGDFNDTNTTYDALLFNFSTSDVDYYVYNLSQDISNASVQTRTFNLKDKPIIGQDGYYYGFFEINGNTSQDNTIGINTSFNISANPEKCEFETLSPETKYCYEVMHGNDDLVLGDGEVFKIKFRLLPAHRMYIGEKFRFIVSSEKGRLDQAMAKTPDVITTLKVPVWPVG